MSLKKWNKFTLWAQFGGTSYRIHMSSIGKNFGEKFMLDKKPSLEFLD